jgi:hypothetical protein
MSIQANPVNWFEIYVQDINRAQQFYQTVLNVEMMKLDVPPDTGDGLQMVSFPFVENGPNATGALVQVPGVPSGGNSTMVYFTCDDCETEQNRVESAGGHILKEKFPIGPYGFCSICLDTEGNAFGLHSMK